MSRSRSERALQGLAAAAALWLLAVTGCDGGTCVRESDCRGGTVCRVGRCVMPDDAGPLPDAPSFDTGDAPGLDAAADAPLRDTSSVQDAPGEDAFSSEDAFAADALAADAFVDAFGDDAFTDDAFTDDAFTDDAFTDDAGP